MFFLSAERKVETFGAGALAAASAAEASASSAGSDFLVGSDAAAAALRALCVACRAWSRSATQRPPRAPRWIRRGGPRAACSRGPASPIASCLPRSPRRRSRAGASRVSAASCGTSQRGLPHRGRGSSRCGRRRAVEGEHDGLHKGRGFCPRLAIVPTSMTETPPSSEGCTSIDPHSKSTRRPRTQSGRPSCESHPCRGRSLGRQRQRRR